MKKTQELIIEETYHQVNGLMILCGLSLDKMPLNKHTLWSDYLVVYDEMMKYLPPSDQLQLMFLTQKIIMINHVILKK